MTIVFTIPNVFGGQSGAVPVSQIDVDLSTIQAALSGLVAATTDLPLTRAYTGTQRWAKGANLTAAATLALGSDGNYFTVTGNTGITAISSLEAGTLIILTFTGTPIITHSSPALILQGATNAQIASGDVYVFMSDGGGNWREVTRRVTTNADATHFLNGQGVLAIPAASSPAFIGAMGTLSGNQSYTSGVAAVLVVNTSEYDTTSILNTGTGVFTVPAGKTGKWQITFHVAWSATGGGADPFLYELRKNGVVYTSFTRITGTGASTEVQPYTIILSLTAADTIDLRLTQTSGGAINALAGTRASFISMSLVGT